MFVSIMDLNNLEYPYQSYSNQIFVQNPLNYSLTLVKGLIGYAQQDLSLIDFQTTKYRIKELTEFMDAYTVISLTICTSETTKKLYCLNLTMQQECEYKSQQKTFHLTIDISSCSDTDKKHTKLTQTLFEQLALYEQMIIVIPHLNLM